MRIRADTLILYHSRSCITEGGAGQPLTQIYTYIKVWETRIQIPTVGTLTCWLYSSKDLAHIHTLACLYRSCQGVGVGKQPCNDAPHILAAASRLLS
jgi:hypothetical protein